MQSNGGSEVNAPLHKLSELPLGTKGIIRKINSEEIKVGLLSLGLTLGEQVTLSDLAPFGGPIALKLHGTKVAIRKQDAASILVEVAG
jgi:ferrous iron transport protein A